jgi:7-carboxy-7-deazaguanine synthase
MTYTVKEIFYTLQGEGINAGRPAVFCRFSGCNLWTGREADRGSATCQFCDTDFVGVGPDGGKFTTAEALAASIDAHWPANAPRSVRKFVVCTGGEPLLQLDPDAIDALHALGFEIAVESNGTLAAPAGIDWLCVSPKARATLVQTHGSELKLVYPQREPEGDPARYAELAFDHFLLQPMDGPRRAENTAAAIAYCLAHPQWRLSVQTHKDIGVR